MEVCRAGVDPCQRELNTPVGEPIALDIFIISSTSAQEEQPLKLVAWETHFHLWGDGEFQLGGQLPVGQSKVEPPVREQGHAGYTLERLLRQKDEIPDPNADYYTVQNQFNEETGQLDYAVTLLDFGDLQPLLPLVPGSSRDRWLIGRIVFTGQTPGSIQVSPHAESPVSFQAISLSEPEERLPIPLTAASPLATVRVGPPPGTLDLEGWVAGSSSMELVVTFWNAGAFPTWRQGPDEPVATFKEIVSDAKGSFRIADISPAILPPDRYDVRVKARHTLGNLTSQVTVPASDSGPAASRSLSVEWDSLRFGDLDNNHMVDEADVAELKASFGRRPGESKFHSWADFNSDQVVDGQDFPLLAQNYLKRSQ